MRRGKKQARRTGRPSLSARLISQVRLEARAGGEVVACFEDHSLDLGTFSTAAAQRAESLRAGLPLRAFASRRSGVDEEIHRLLRRLAGHGLLEYRLTRSANGADAIVIEPQTPDYWPQTAPLCDGEVLAFSRFAYLRRRGNDMVLESPRAGALFRICDPDIAAALATLATPRPVKELRRRKNFPADALLALLLDCQILFKVGRARDGGMRPAEGDASLVLWDFHDLLFHARSTQGRHANPIGGVYPYADVVPALPAVRPLWPGKKIDLHKFAAGEAQASGLAKLLRERHSTRSFDDARPITLAELARFLDATARVQSKEQGKVDVGEDGPVGGYAMRPYPSGGGSYEFELYLAVHQCAGLARSFYHYDAGGHTLVPIAVRPQALDAAVQEAAFAMGTPAAPQILITIAARFGRVSWKYSALAYALILKDVGVLMQTFYLMATEMGLGACALGTANIDLFAKMTGLELHVEGPVGQFAIGRGSS